MTQFRDCMVDIETTGLNPGRNAIIQIAAVRFDIATREIDTSSFFDECLHIPPTRYWGLDTMHWWSNQKAEVLRTIQGRMRDPKTVLEEFTDWVGGYQNLRFWAKPTHFDFAFVQHYFVDFDMPMPFSFREAVDMRSFAVGAAFPNEMENPQVTTGGYDAHNALHDCLMQIEWAFKVANIKETGNAETHR